MSLKPLTRAHRTIQHFSKNTPQHKTNMTSRRSRTRLKAHTFPDDFSSACIGMVAGYAAFAADRRLALPQSRRLVTSLQNRTALFNIASIFCLSMLFSKNSGNSFFRTPLRRTLPNIHNTVPFSGLASQGSLPKLNSASPNQAGDI